MFDSYLNESILKRAQEKKKIKFFFYNPREYTKDKWKRVDDRPYAGGPGMVMMVDPLMRAYVKAIARIARLKKTKVKTVLFSPGGAIFTNEYARSLVQTKYTDVIFICGRYEGIDERVVEITKCEKVSIGPYVLTGGELPAMVCVDAVSRHIDGVLGNAESPEEERVSSHEVYTRPEVYVYKKKQYTVPNVLLSGDHKKIEEWKKKIM